MTGSRSGSLAMLTANPTQLICGKAQKAPGQDDQGLIMGGCGGFPSRPINDQQALVPARTARL